MVRLGLVYNSTINCQYVPVYLLATPQSIATEYLYWLKSSQYIDTCTSHDNASYYDENPLNIAGAERRERVRKRETGGEERRERREGGIS